MTIPKIWKQKHVPNHHPDIYLMYNYTRVKPCRGYFSWGKVSKKNSALNIMELLWIAKCCTTKMMVETCHVCWNSSDIMGCLPPIKYLKCCRISRCARCARLPDCPMHPRQVVKRGLVWTEYLGNVATFSKDGLVWKASVFDHSTPLKHLRTSWTLISTPNHVLKNIEQPKVSM